MKKLTTVLLLLLFGLSFNKASAQNYIITKDSLYFKDSSLLNMSYKEQFLQDSSIMQQFAEKLGHYPSNREFDSVFFLDRMALAKSKNIHHSSFLKKLHEPILCDGYPHEVYRLTWHSGLLAYEYHPYSIRIESFDDGKHFVYFSYVKWDRRHNQLPSKTDVWKLDEATWNEFLALLEKLCFWDMPSEQETTIAVYDGNTLILEGYKGNRYQAVFRKESLDSAIDQISLYLWNLTGIRKNKCFARGFWPLWF